MIVVSNTSPINYLILIEQIDLLRDLFQAIVIPQAVCDELSVRESPPLVRDWIANAPSWLSIQSVGYVTNSDTERLDRGEQEAIILAEELNADLILLDDMKARNAAIDKGLRTTGILGILDRAAAMKIIELPIAVEKLKHTSFWVWEALLQRLLKRHISISNISGT